MTVAVVVQARWASSRCPGKILEPLGRGTVLSEGLRRLSAMKRADVIVVAVPDTPESQPIEDVAASLGHRVVRGSEMDVLDRFLQAARAVDAAMIVRVTSDCPLTDPLLCDAVVDVRAAADVDYASNNMPPSFPHGLDCECFTRDALERAAATATKPEEREHVTPWLRRHPSISRAVVRGPGLGIDERWTIDYPEDLLFLQSVWPLIEDGDLTGWRNVLRRLDSAPSISDINRSRRVVGRT